jgi:PX domain
MCKRRYSEFVTLWSTVAAVLHIDTNSIAQLPPKLLIWQDSTAPAVIQTRREQLTNAIHKLLSTDGVAQLPTTRAFLAVPNDY